MIMLADMSTQCKEGQRSHTGKEPVPLATATHD
jgi:hypothetical protein